MRHQPGREGGWGVTGGRSPSERPDVPWSSAGPPPLAAAQGAWGRVQRAPSARYPGFAIHSFWFDPSHLRIDGEELAISGLVPAPGILAASRPTRRDLAGLAKVDPSQFQVFLALKLEHDGMRPAGQARNRARRQPGPPVRLAQLASVQPDLGIPRLGDEIDIDPQG